MGLSHKRTILGVVVLLIVNVIWVLSSELTSYIFKNEHYSKPFLSTYLKSSMFSLFLLGFVFSSHWRMLACPNQYYSSSELFTLEKNDDDEAESDDRDILSDPIYLPVNFEPSDEDNLKKPDEADYLLISEEKVPDLDNVSSQEISKRSVTFSKYLEVRHLSDTYAEESLVARMSYNASRKLHRQLLLKRILDQGIYPATTVLKIALQFCFCWFVANYAYQMGLMNGQPAVVNVISCTSSLFTLILASIFPSSERDKFTVTKLFAVLLSMGGVVVISFSDTITLAYAAIVWSLVGAVGYAVYLVNLRRKVKDEKQMSLLMFFGFVGFWTVICLWPGLFVVHWIDIEPFVLPNNTQMFSMLINGFIGTLGAELLWLWGCLLTSSLTATLSLGLTIPLSMIADYIMKKKLYKWSFYCGSIPILVSFVIISYLTKEDGPSPDPIGNFFKLLWRRKSSNVGYEKVLQTDSDEEDSTNCPIKEQQNLSHTSVLSINNGGTAVSEYKKSVMSVSPKLITLLNRDTQEVNLKQNNDDHLLLIREFQSVNNDVPSCNDQ